MIKHYMSITKARKMSRSASLNNRFKTTLLMILQNTIDPAKMAKMTSGITIAFRRLSMTVDCRFQTLERLQGEIMRLSQSA